MLAQKSYVSTFFDWTVRPVTAAVKSAAMGVTMWNIGEAVFNFVTGQSQEDQSTANNCQEYPSNIGIIISMSSLVLVLGTLLFYSKYSQTKASPGLDRLHQQPSLINDIESGSGSEEALDYTSTLIGASRATYYVNPEEHSQNQISSNRSRLFSGFKLTCSALFTGADAVLNARIFLSLSPWAGLNYSLYALALFLFVNQNISYGHQINSGERYRFHNSFVGKGLDYIAVLFRVIAAKKSLFNLIEKQGFNEGIKVFLQILGIAEPTLFLSKWSNYQNLKTQDFNYTGCKVFNGVLIDILYAAQDSPLYAEGLASNETVDKLIFQCSPKYTMLFAAAFAVSELIAYGEKFIKVTHSEEVKSMVTCGRR